MNIAFGIALQNDPVTPANLDWFFSACDTHEKVS